MNLDEPLPIREMLLERLRVGHASQFSMDQLEVMTYLDPLWNRWTIKVVTSLLAERLPSETVTDTKAFNFSFPATWWDHFKECHKGAWYLRWAKPARFETKTKTAHFSVNISRYWAFPQAQIPIPQLGPPIRVVIPGPLHVEWQS